MNQEQKSPSAGAKPRETYRAKCGALLRPFEAQRHCRWEGPVRATSDEAAKDFEAHAHPWGGGWSIQIIREA